jgi:outer membrane protein assembly factor BamB
MRFFDTAKPDAHRAARAEAILISLTSLLAAFAAGCAPTPGGQCDIDADCAYGTTCQDGLCRAAPPRACAPSCGAGFHCNDGSCALDVAPTTTWVSPAEGTYVKGGVIALSLTVETPATDVVVRVIAEPAQPSAKAAPVGVTLVAASDGTYRGLLDASGLEERAWNLRPVVSAAKASWAAPVRMLSVDRTGPTLDLTLPDPVGAPSFLRSATVTVRARARDSGAGVDPESLAVIGEGMAPIAGTRVSSIEWSFQLPLSAPAFHAAEGPLLFGIRARDRIGNESVMPASLPVTRLLWRRDVGGGLPIDSSPALDSKRIFIGTGAAKVVAVDRQTGVPLWSRPLGGPVSASPVRGDTLVYAVSEAGDLRALDPDSGDSRWTCPGLPAGLSFHASPALYSVQGLGAGGAPLEALVVQSSGTFALASGASVRGGVFALQGSAGFPVAGGERACWVLAQVSGGRSSPAVAEDGAIYVGGDDARAHKLRLGTDATGAFSFNEEWSFPGADDLGASPALVPGMAAFADDAGRVSRIGADGALLGASPEAVGQKLLSSPVIAFGSLLLLGRDGALTPFPLGGSALATSALDPTFLPSQIGDASGIEATPAIGAEGTLYVSAGRSLRAISPSGGVLWELPLGGAATASSPVVGCDGTLFVADASGALSAISTDSKGLAAGWPRFRHDARGTGNAATAGCE